ncbi:MAG: hypothetical protein COA33_010130 [Fluviicola sp.]|nr:hypothetical protein [Fluviicola sp.]
MFGRIILALTVIASITWIAFVGFDILNVKSNFTPETLFTTSDEQILIINRPSEVQLQQVNGFVASPMFDVTSSFLTKEFELAYISFSQSHLLIKGKNNWTEESISDFFNNSVESIAFSGSDFSFGDYDGRYFKASLYLKKGEIDASSENISTFSYDKKASASVVKFNDKTTEISDIYFLENGRVDYITRNENILQGKQIKDEEVFASVLTSKFSTYHFFERDYYATVDSIFNSGAMYQWLQNGFVEINYKGKTAIITDYVDGQDPVLILNDLNQSLDKQSFSNQLTATFPTKNSSFFIKYMEDLVVLSESETTCDNIIADFKLGNTIVLNQAVHFKVFGKLPKKVSERFISNESTYSKAVYQGKILQTQFGAEVHEQLAIEKETVSMNVGFDILDFSTLKGNGNVVVLGKNGELSYYENAELKWNKAIEGRITGGLQTIDLFSNGEVCILLNTEDKIHLWKENGEYSSGFPIQLEDEASNEVKFYRWRGKSYFLIANIEQQVLQFDGEGRELNIVKSKELISQQIDVWASQSKLFAGFSNESFFEMYNLDKNRSHRTFKLPTKMIAAKIPNELIQFGLENEALIKIDQKGGKLKYSSYNNAEIIKVENTNKNPVIILKSANEIILINKDGISFSQLKIPFNEVDNVELFTSNSGKTILAIVDGLENNVYLYGANGEKVIDKALEGQNKVELNNFGNHLQVTTIVDQFLVQYYE